MCSRLLDFLPGDPLLSVGSGRNGRKWFLPQRRAALAETAKVK